MLPLGSTSEIETYSCADAFPIWSRPSNSPDPGRGGAGAARLLLVGLLLVRAGLLLVVGLLLLGAGLLLVARTSPRPTSRRRNRSPPSSDSATSTTPPIAETARSASALTAPASPNGRPTPTTSTTTTNPATSAARCRVPGADRLIHPPPRADARRGPERVGALWEKSPTRFGSSSDHDHDAGGRVLAQRSPCRPDVDHDPGETPQNRVPGTRFPGVSAGEAPYSWIDFISRNSSSP